MFAQPNDSTLRHFAYWGCGFLGALAFYALSLGPAAKIHKATDHQGLRHAIETAYTPLEWVVKHSDTAGAAAYYYVNLWVDR
jgi:hypothetical protein